MAGIDRHPLMRAARAHSWRMLALASIAMMATASALAAEAVSFNSVRSAISAGTDGLSGPGAVVLHDAIESADFVFLGEDHGVHEIAGFISALCRSDLGPRGFAHVAVETGPVAAERIETVLRDKDPQAAMARFDREFPDALTFFNVREELQWLRDCERAVGKPLDLIGADQEFVGAASMLLDAAHSAASTDAQRRLVTGLQQTEATQRRKAFATGDVGQYYLLRDNGSELAPVLAALDPAARAYLEAIGASQRIYALNASNSRRSNRERALLMKKQFFDALEAAGVPRTFVRMGAYHGYKGFNPLDNLDLGNAIAEFADRSGRKSVHIMVVAVAGEQLAFAGPGKMRPAKFNFLGDNPVFADLKPLVDLAQAHPETYSLFDLTRARAKRELMESATPELKRLAFGMDYLVLIPLAHATVPIVDAASRSP